MLSLLRLIISLLERLIVLPKCDCSYIVIVYTGALSGILPVFMLRKSVALGELECVVFGAFHSILSTHNVLIPPGPILKSSKGLKLYA